MPLISRPLTLLLVLLIAGLAAPEQASAAAACKQRRECSAGTPRWQPKGPMSFTLDYSTALPEGKLDVSGSDIYILPLQIVEQAAARGGRGAAKLDELQCGRSKKLVCYTNCGAYEPGHWNEDLLAGHRDKLMGGTMAGYPEERWLDIRQLDLLRPLIADKFARAAAVGCDALTCDNTEAWITGTDGKDGEALDLYRAEGVDAVKSLARRHVRKRTGVDISYADQLAYNRMLAEEAHRLCLSIGLINDVFQIEELAGEFDFAINEQCHHCGWCDLYGPFVAAGKPVLHIEFDDNEGFCRAGSSPVEKICRDLDKQRLTTFWTTKRLASSKLHAGDRPRTCK